MDDFAIRFIISWNINYLWCVDQDLYFIVPIMHGWYPHGRMLT